MVKTYAVNTFDAWLNSEGDDISESYVKYQDYAALEEKMLALLDHPVMKAHTDALREAQTTGLAFIRVNANGHVQALPSDRVRISVIQAVEERTAAAAHQECGDATPPAPCDHEFTVNDHRDKCLYCGAKLK